MKKLNVIIVYDKTEEKILMCKREKEPYKGLFNLVGGKLEKDEEEYTAAYRELQEETGISSNDIKLTHIIISIITTTCSMLVIIYLIKK